MRLLVPFVALAAVGCHGSTPPPDADEALACIATGRGETYAVGLEHAGALGALDFKLMAATPAPPGFNDNTWIIQINALAGGVVGAPVSGATITVTPFMPDHQHGTPLRAKVEPTAEPGQYKLSPINMWMPGYWEITISAQTATARDSVVYKFCIQA